MDIATDSPFAARRSPFSPLIKSELDDMEKIKIKPLATTKNAVLMCKKGSNGTTIESERGDKVKTRE